MNDYEIATVVFALKQLQRACPGDTYEQQVAKNIGFSSLILVPHHITHLVEEMEAAA